MTQDVVDESRQLLVMWEDDKMLTSQLWKLDREQRSTDSRDSTRAATECRTVHTEMNGVKEDMRGMIGQMKAMMVEQEDAGRKARREELERWETSLKSRETTQEEMRKEWADMRRKDQERCKDQERMCAAMLRRQEAMKQDMMKQEALRADQGFATAM